MPNTCILILNYNGLEYIEKCLNSFLKTDLLANCEILVVDNKSTDGSLELLLKTYSNSSPIRIIPLEKNYGFGSGFMRGIEIAKPTAEYLVFSSVDLFVEPNWLSEILKVFGQNSQVGIVSPVICEYDDRDTIQVAGTHLANLHLLPLTVSYGSKENYQDYLQTHKRPYPVVCPSGPLMIADQKHFSRIGGFDPSFFLWGEELDLGLRTWITGKKVLIAPNSRVYHKMGFSTRSQPKTIRRRKFIFLYHKNVLRTLIKSVPARNFSDICLSWAYLFVYALAEALILRDSMIVAMNSRAFLWNLKNIRDTLVHRHALKFRNIENLRWVVRSSLFRELYAIARIALNEV